MDHLSAPEAVAADHTTERSHGLWAVWEFLVEVLVGTAIFGVVAAGAVSMDLFNRTLESWGVDMYVRAGLRTAEYSVLVADLVLFMIFLWKSGSRTAQRL